MWTILCLTNSYLLFIHYREQYKVSTRLRKRVIYDNNNNNNNLTINCCGEFEFSAKTINALLSERFTNWLAFQMRLCNDKYFLTFPYHTIPYHTIPYHAIPYHISHHITYVTSHITLHHITSNVMNDITSHISHHMKCHISHVTLHHIIFHDIRFENVVVMFSSRVYDY